MRPRDAPHGLRHIVEPVKVLQRLARKVPTLATAAVLARARVRLGKRRDRLPVRLMRIQQHRAVQHGRRHGQARGCESVRLVAPRDGDGAPERAEVGKEDAVVDRLLRAEGLPGRGPVDVCVALQGGGRGQVGCTVPGGVTGGGAGCPVVGQVESSGPVGGARRVGDVKVDVGRAARLGTGLCTAFM